MKKITQKRWAEMVTGKNVVPCSPQIGPKVHMLINVGEKYYHVKNPADGSDDVVFSETTPEKFRQWIHTAPESEIGNRFRWELRQQYADAVTAHIKNGETY